MNPIGCDETVVVVRCAGCEAIYFEIEEDGFSHPDGPLYRAIGPYSDGEEIIGHVQPCRHPINKLCKCRSHKYMEEVMFSWGRTLKPWPGLAAGRSGFPKDDSAPPEVAAPEESEGAEIPNEVTQLSLFEDSTEVTSLKASTEELRTVLEGALPEARVKVGMKSMAWVRGKLRSRR